MVEDDSRLDTRNPTIGIDLEDVAHVPGEIEHDGHVAALSGEGGSTAAAKKRSTKFAAHRNCSENIVVIARENDPDWNLPIVGTVGRVHRTRTIVETDIAADLNSESLGQAANVHCRRFR